MAADAATVDGAVEPDASVFPAGAPPLGVCRDDWCWVYPRPQGNDLKTIWGMADDDVWVAAAYDSLLHYDGTEWTEFVVVGATNRTSRTRVWGTASDNVWAANEGVWHWDGVSWSLSESVPMGMRVTALGGTGPNDVWAIMADDEARHWNGSSWTERPVPAVGWNTIALGGASGSGETVNVSAQGGIARWLGSTWGIAEASTRPLRYAVVVGDTQIVATEAGGVSFWDGAGWTTNSPPVDASWGRLAATSLDDVWVIGYDAIGHRYFHWDGTSWTEAPRLTEHEAVGMWRSPSGNLWVAHRTEQVRVFDGTCWGTGNTLGKSWVEAVWGTAEDDIWIISSRNETIHWDGTRWTEVAFPSFAHSISGIWGSAPDDYWIAGGWEDSGGSDSLRYMFHWDGSEWTAVGPFGTEWGSLYGFDRVWGTARDDVYALSQTAVYHYDGTTWSLVEDLPSPPDRSFYRDVFGTAADDVYVLEEGADRGALWQWDGIEWSSKATPVEVDRGWANSPADIWLSSSRSRGVVHYDGTFFTTCCASSVEGSPMGTASEMFAVIWVVADGWYIFRWDDGFLGETSMTRAFFHPSGGGWLSPSGRLYAAGSGGPSASGGLVVHIP